MLPFVAAPALAAFAPAVAPLAGSAVSSAGEMAAGIVGIDAFVGAVGRTAVKLARAARNEDERTAREMQDAMRGRVPQDSGRLLNGISWERDGDVMVVSARAENPFDDVDYAPFVEYGLDAGSRRVGGGDPFDHPGQAAQPFFWPSVEEVAQRRAVRLAGILGDL